MENNEQDIVKGMSEDRKLAEDYILNYTKHKKDYERKKGNGWNRAARQWILTLAAVKGICLGTRWKIWP